MKEVESVREDQARQIQYRVNELINRPNAKFIQVDEGITAEKKGKDIVVKIKDVCKGNIDEEFVGTATLFINKKELEVDIYLNKEGKLVGSLDKKE